MKIGIISDIHGNLEALKTTLQDMKKRKIDKIICLGDIIAKGVHAKECIQLVRENCDIVLQGNCDRYFSGNHDFSQLEEQEIQRIKWNQKMLSKQERDYLANLPFSDEFYLSGSLVRMFHATPKRDDVPVINYDNIETKWKQFLPSSKTKSQKVADIVIYGHIHHPYLDQLYNKTLINVGSVGNAYDVIRNLQKDSSPRKTTKSNYLILEGEWGSKEDEKDISFQLMKLQYDIEKELQEEDKNLEKESYHYELTQGRYRNMNQVNQHFQDIGVDISKL